MPADFLTSMEAGSAADSQTSNAQQAIGSLQSTTAQGAQALNEYTNSAQNQLSNYTGQGAAAANSAATGSLDSTSNYINSAASAYAPYMATGAAANNQLMNLLGLGAGGSSGMQSALAQTPGYQFTLQQGLNAAQNNATSQGLGVSGAALKAASGYATGLADSTYQNQVTNALNASNLGLTGAQGASTALQTGANLANNAYGTLSNNLTNLYGSGATTSANLYGNEGQSLAGLYSNEGQNVAGQYNTIGNANAAADYATAQAFQNTESELISAAGSSGKMGA